MTASLTNAFGWIVTRPAALRRAIKDLFRKDVSKASFHAVATIYEWYVDNETGDLDATWYACFENALGERKAVFGYTNPALRTHEGKSLDYLTVIVPWLSGQLETKALKFYAQESRLIFEEEDSEAYPAILPVVPPSGHAPLPAPSPTLRLATSSPRYFIEAHR